MTAPNLTRRGLLGIFAAGASAAIIRTPGLLMPVKPVRDCYRGFGMAPLMVEGEPVMYSGTAMSLISELNEASVTEMLLDIRKYVNASGRKIFIRPTRVMYAS